MFRGIFLLYSIFSGALGSPGILLSFSTITIPLHITIILTMSLIFSIFL